MSDLSSAILINALDAVLAVMMAFACWRRRKTPATLPMCACMGSVFLWSLFNVLKYADHDHGRKLFWMSCGYLGSATAPYSFFLLALTYVKLRDSVRHRVGIVCLLPPVVFCTVAFTNPWHQLLWRHIVIRPDNLIQFEHGPAYWYAVAPCGYFFYFAGMLLILRMVIGLPRHYWKMSLLLLVSISIPFIFSICYSFGFLLSGVDPTPMGLAFTVSGLYAGLMSRQIFDVAPIARHLLVERMREGMLAFDAQKKLVDHNHATEVMTGVKLHIGTEASSLPSPWNQLEPSLAGMVEAQVELTGGGSDRRWFEADVSTLAGPDRIDGYFLLIREITERKILESHLESMALHDALTGLYNRHYLDAEMARDVMRCLRQNAPMAVVMFDLDCFKEVNDRYGHQTGDAVLRTFGQFLLKNIRGSDFACRFGGEEFVLVLPGTSSEVALERIRRWCAEFAALDIPWNGGVLHETFSAGVASFPQHGDDPDLLLQAADRALYLAKAQGRNQVVLASEEEKEA